MIVKRSEFQRVVSEDLNPDPSYLDQAEWADRKEAYNRSEFHFVGVQAKVELRVPLTANIVILVPIITPGVWLIESDSPEETFKEQFDSECDMLTVMLESIAALKLVP